MPGLLLARQRPTPRRQTGAFWQAPPSFSLRPAATVEWTIRFLPCSLDCGKTYEAHVVRSTGTGSGSEPACRTSRRAPTLGTSDAVDNSNLANLALLPLPAVSLRCS